MSIPVPRQFIEDEIYHLRTMRNKWGRDSDIGKKCEAVMDGYQHLLNETTGYKTVTEFNDDALKQNIAIADQIENER